MHRKSGGHDSQGILPVNPKIEFGDAVAQQQAEYYDLVIAWITDRWQDAIYLIHARYKRGAGPFEFNKTNRLAKKTTIYIIKTMI